MNSMRLSCLVILFNMSLPASGAIIDLAGSRRNLGTALRDAIPIHSRFYDHAGKKIFVSGDYRIVIDPYNLDTGAISSLAWVLEGKAFEDHFTLDLSKANITVEDIDGSPIDVNETTWRKFDSMLVIDPGGRFPPDPCHIITVRIRGRRPKTPNRDPELGAGKFSWAR